MYEDYYRFKRKPFSIAPDPGFLFLSDRHREALAHLMYGLETEGGFVLVTGEVGTGKTTLIRSLIDRIPSGIDVAFVLNPRVTAQELLETLCEELRVEEAPGGAHTVKHYVDRLTKHLLRTHELGRSTVLIIDEAQNLSPSVLEQIRLLTNLETNEQKLLRIILLGQPELGELLDRREMRQLSQRITARYHLAALDAPETEAYLAHRLSLAGGSPNLFTRAASRRIHRLSGGIPRLINVIADRALLGAYVEGKPRVGAAIVARAGREVLGRGGGTRFWLFAALGFTALIGGAWAYFGVPQLRTAAPPATQRMAPQAQLNTQANPARVPVAPAPTEDTQSPPPISPEVAVTASNDASEAQLVAAVAEGITPTNASGQSLARPADLTPYQTQRLAYGAVFDRWGQVPPENDVPCNGAVAFGLQCLRETGGWTALVRDNRPAVLELWDAQAQPFYGAAIGVQGTRLTLRIGDSTIDVERDLLERHWYGNFVVLWRMPPYYRGSLELGDEDDTVAWLRVQLAPLVGADLHSPAKRRFDQTLHDALVRFQRDAGLVPDGIAGPATWIALAGASGADEPRLASGK